MEIRLRKLDVPDVRAYFVLLLVIGEENADDVVKLS